VGLNEVPGIIEHGLDFGVKPIREDLMAVLVWEMLDELVEAGVDEIDTS
jgi:hypothetical protein